MANTSVSLVDLDFAAIKSNLKTFLKRSDSPFKDVDFEGSNITQLLDVLAYNTYLNNFYVNMVASEMFLDTATLRDSIISHAKELNYVPRSFTSAQAQISFTITPSTALGSIVIPKGTTFTSKVGSNNYSFATEENVIVNANTDGKFYANLAVYEGIYTTDSFVYVASNTTQRFVISNPTVDTRSITVTVLENNAANVYTYSKASSFLGLSANSKSFFLQAAENSQYEVLFGDGVVGRQPQNGATILVEYRTCNGELPNGARVFDVDGPIQGQANISSITTISNASGGSVNESPDKIKFNAVRHYQNQERAVTATDYESILLANFPEIQAVAAFGGEDATPPVYGKVYITVDIYNADGVPDANKLKYYNFIKPRCSLSIDPVFLDPEFLYAEVKTNVKYNVNLTTLKTTDISTLAKASVSSYCSDNINGFKKTLFLSRLIEGINSAHNSIISNETYVVPFKLIAAVRGESYTKTFNFGFPLSQYFTISYDDFIRSKVKAVYSTSFTYNGILCSMQDDENGNLCVYSMSGFDTNTLIDTVGTVDYNTGVVTITDLVVDDFVPASGDHIHLYVNPASKDISSSKNIILTVRDNDIEVTVEPVKA